MVSTRSTYKSNTTYLGREIEAKLERIVRASAEEGASYASARANPDVRARAQKATNEYGIIRVAVTYPSTQFWATMLDRGTLGKRKYPVKQPGKRKSTWTARRKVKGTESVTAGGYSTAASREVTYHRSGEALKSGGIRPQYFFVRGKNVAMKTLAKNLKNAL